MTSILLRKSGYKLQIYLCILFNKYIFRIYNIKSIKRIVDQLRKSREFLKTNVILKIGTTKRSTEYMCNFEN